MKQRCLDLVFLGLSLSSSWGNGHATTYRALLRGLAERGHRSLFLERDVPGYAAARDLPRPDFCDLELYHDIADLPVRFGERIATADAVVVGSYVPDGIAVTIHQLPWPRWNRTVVPISPHGNRRSSISIFPSPADPYWGIWPIASACVGPALHCAVDAALYRPQNLQPTWDLGYLGTYARDRQPALERLLLEPARRLPDRRFVIAGPQYPDSIAWPANVERIEHLPPAQHAAFYCRQRFTLNVTRADMVRTGWSPSVRLFEAAACGAPVISDRWPGLDALLPDGVAIMIADDADEVVSVLCGLDDGRRLRISSSARDIVLADHTGVARGRELEQNLCACMDESPTQDFSSYASDLIEQGYRDLSPHLASCFLVAVRPRKSHDHVRD